MRLARVQSGDRIGLARKIGDVVHVTFAPGAADLDRLVQHGSCDDVTALFADGEVANEGSLTFLPPLITPPKIICVGLNYVDHATETAFQVPEFPTLFGRFRSSLIGHEAPLIKPALSDQFDFEGEMVAVIGTGGRDITRDQALDHVKFYSVFNDGSVRDYQMKSPQWTAGKNFDGTGAFGPWLVSADELPAGAAGLRIETRLNGQVVQSASTSDMVFDVAELVSILSTFMTLESGDVIVTGTPAGVGMARTPQLWMKDGDVCEVEIEQIGLLRNRVQA